MNATQIVAYTYRAEILCPACVIESMVAHRDASPATRDMGAEPALDQIAGANAIDREDEYSFDSSYFPKVVLSSQVEPDEYCNACYASIA